MAGTRMVYTKEELDFIKEKYYEFGLKDSYELYRNKFNKNIDLKKYKALVDNHKFKVSDETRAKNHCKGKKIWNDGWLIENCDKFFSAREMLEEYNKVFSTNFTYSAISTKLNKLNIRCQYTHDFDEKWVLLNHAKHETNTSLRNEYNKVHNTHFNKDTFNQHLTKLGINKYQIPSIGHLCKTTRGEWFIKVSEGAGRNKKNYMSYQNHLYKKTKGEIPDTHCVVFADGNRENFDVSNLILVKKKNVGALFGSMKLYGSGDLILAADKMLELNTMIKEFAG